MARNTAAQLEEVRVYACARVHWNRWKLAILLRRKARCAFAGCFVAWRDIAATSTARHRAATVLGRKLLLSRFVGRWSAHARGSVRAGRLDRLADSARASSLKRRGWAGLCGRLVKLVVLRRAANRVTALRNTRLLGQAFRALHSEVVLRETAHRMRRATQAATVVNFLARWRANAGTSKLQRGRRVAAAAFRNQQLQRRC